MSTSTFYLKNNRLSLTHADIRESFDVDNIQVLQDFSAEYLALLEQREPDKRADLLAIGEKLAQWLNKTSWLERLLVETRGQELLALRLSCYLVYNSVKILKLTGSLPELAVIFRLEQESLIYES
jgi:hypothetical protein